MINLHESPPAELNFHQRWASYLTILAALVGLVGGAFLHSRNLNATQLFENKEAGISAQYPTNWLLQQGKTSGGALDYVFRAQDPSGIPFKTTLQVSLIPVGPQARAADIPDLLNMTRATAYAAYRPLAIVPVALSKDVQGIQMTYAFVSSETNQFLQSVPIVVEAEDVIVLHSSRAVIITYKADSQSFDRDHHYFDSFLTSLIQSLRS